MSAPEWDAIRERNHRQRLGRQRLAASAQAFLFERPSLVPGWIAPGDWRKGVSLSALLCVLDEPWRAAMRRAALAARVTFEHRQRTIRTDIEACLDQLSLPEDLAAAHAQGAFDK